MPEVCSICRLNAQAIDSEIGHTIGHDNNEQLHQGLSRKPLRHRGYVLAAIAGVSWPDSIVTTSYSPGTVGGSEVPHKNESEPTTGCRKLSATERLNLNLIRQHFGKNVTERIPSPFSVSRRVQPSQINGIPAANECIAEAPTRRTFARRANRSNPIQPFWRGSPRKNLICGVSRERTCQKRVLPSKNFSIKAGKFERLPRLRT